MTVTVEFTIPADAFALGRLFSGATPLRIELEAVVPVGEAFVPFVRVEGPTDLAAAFERRVRTDERVAGLRRMESELPGRFYRVEWERPVADELLAYCEAHEIQVQRARARGQTWSVRVLAEGDEARGLGELVVTSALPITVTKLHSSVTACTAAAAEPRLSPPQREALTVALEQGYFEVPREITLEELGEEFDISRQAVTRRLQRGIRRLVETHCAPLDA